ncbi:MAG: hypothetical protein IT426_09195 [Pirellulales bacterium]|nr:hypothetical protein [Pirellulales bacterium]
MNVGRLRFSNNLVVMDNRRPKTEDFRRTILGILAVLFMLGALVFEIRPPTQAFGLECQSACWRLAPLLAVFWIAYPDLNRIPWWLWLALPVLLFILVKWPKTILFFIPILIFLAILKLRIKPR